MRPSSLIIVASFACFIVSFSKRNELPRSIEPLPEIAREPAQTPTTRTPFIASYEGVRYEIEPAYDYDLYGLVVSFRHHDGRSRMHRQANDHLNMLDVCVVWGANAVNPRLEEFDFWNGIFTCNVETRSRPAWESFDMFQLSNNHLISDDEFVRNAVTDLQVGDQIRVRGFLASYGVAGGGKRGTSTTRRDTGDGACETLYVEQFEVARPARNFWRQAAFASLTIGLIASVLHFRRPYRPYRQAGDGVRAFLDKVGWVNA